ncbi:hypothetical protein [Rhizobium sp. 9140]|uniref:hypothetical protein n=1 Tax=Rhizobium sp. 9140 TaxID=1761900 RepID=UPI000792E9CD|nr:hypothetical protein [Rhizobium sp. 9140]CZT38072.1 hypothetical protein GA0004734_00049470 [Rhizobium sp. 9140]
MQTEQNTKPEKGKGPAWFVAPEEHRPRLAVVSGFFASLSRRDTATALEAGRHLANAQEVLPGKSFGKWVKQECGLTTRQAWNYTVCVRMYTAEQQERLIELAVKPTVMATLATAEAEKIVVLLDRMEAGERFTVGKLKNEIRGEAPVKSPANPGGAAGLLRAAQAKFRAETEAFNKIVRIVLKAVEKIAADIDKGKSVPKTRLADAVERHCQKAGALLSSVVEPVQAVATTPAEWEQVRRIISRLGDSPRWPSKGEFPAWVTEQVLPALRFVVHGTPTAAAETEADVAGSDGEGEGETLGDDALDALSTVVEAAPSRRLHLVAPPSLVPGDAVELVIADEATID